jgi:cysteine desulfurase/selenocysteine lyase
MRAMTTPPPRSSELQVPQLGSRALFPDLQPQVYLAHAAVSPVSTPVRNAVLAVLDDYGRLGVGAFPPWIGQRQRLKEAIGRLIHAAPEDLALVQSTTAGLMALAVCLEWKRGDRVVLTRGEFPANVTPWQQAAKQFGLEIVWLPQPKPYAVREWLDALQVALNAGRVRVVALSAVQFQTGLRMPLDAIAPLCQRVGAELVIDAVQAFGAIPLDVAALGIDYMACGAHKWCNGVEGAGFLYVSPKRVAQLQPRMAGWLSHEDGLGFLFRGAGLLKHDRPIRKSVDFLEIGNLSTASFAGMGAAVDVLESLGVAKIFAHVQPIVDALEAGLVARGFTSQRARATELRSCTLAMLPPPDIDLLLLHKQLTALGIAHSVPDGLLRLAPHWPNAMAEVPLVLAAADAALAQIRADKSSVDPRGS